MAIGEFSVEDLIKKYFPKSLRIIEGQTLIGFKGMRHFFSTSYDFIIDAHKLTNLGLKISCLFYEEAKDYYKGIFETFDAD